MFKRKLNTLEYFNADEFSIFREKDQRDLVVWLEDQKIRHYPIDDRAPLREIANPKWPEVFERYLRDVKCPIDRSDTKAVLDWLVNLAAKLEYSDDGEKYKNATAENIRREGQNEPQIIFRNPLDNLNLHNSDFEEGVKTIAKFLKISLHPDVVVILQAIKKIVERLVQSAGQTVEKIKYKYFPLEDHTLEFKAKDTVVCYAMKILRLVYICDMRKLQTQINECIVLLQRMTASPKTDTKLGKVGF